MANEQTRAALQHLRKVLDAQSVKQLSDGEVLQRFAAHRDEVAFGDLVRRHGPLVLGVCRHVLRHEQDAEDAFQATFLVLARKADSVRKEGALASFLYGVAYRVAMKARRAAARRRRHEGRAAPASESPGPDLGWRELQAVLDEELNQLPEKYRAPFVLCCLASRSKKEAAEELGWKEGTVSSRLAHARKLLQVRLARRGVTLSAVLCGLAVAREGSAAAVPASLAGATLRAGLSFADGSEVPRGSAQAAAWAQGTLRAMTLARAKVPAALLLLVAVAGGGTAAFLPRQPAPPPPAAVASERPADAARPEGPRDGARPAGAEGGPGGPQARPGEGTVAVTGTVIGPDNRPAGGAQVAVLASRYRRAGEPNRATQYQMKLLGEGRTDAEGHYHLDIPQAVVARHSGLTLLTSAPGGGLTAAMLDPTRGVPEVNLQLESPQSVRGRLLEPGGAPARGVRVHVVRMERQAPRGLTVHFPEPPGHLPAWPDPVTTDDDGYFRLTDLGPNLDVHLHVQDERYATQWLHFKTEPKERGGPISFRLQPLRTLEGRLTCADTGLPLANAHLVVDSLGVGADRIPHGIDGRTDENGNFRLRPFPGQTLDLRVYPPGDTPYLVAYKRLQWPRGSARQEVKLAMRRGVLVRGRVTEAESGRPVAGAAVNYRPRWTPAQPPGPGLEDPTVQWQAWDASTGADGAFALAVLPGPGHLLVKADTPDYVHVETTLMQLELGRRGGRPYFPDALIPLDLPPGSGTRQVQATLRRGVTVRGRVLGRDGWPVEEGVLVAGTYIARGWEWKGDPLPFKAGRFELPGCDPRKGVPVWFFDRRHQQGAFVEVPGKGGEEVVVRLVPCRAASAHFVDPAGKPVASTRVLLELVLRDGDDENESVQKGTAARVSVAAWALYGRGYGPFQVHNAGIDFPWLIPGARYAMLVEEKLGWPVKKVFRVPAGEGILQLGDIVVTPRPQPKPMKQ